MNVFTHQQKQSPPLPTPLSSVEQVRVRVKIVFASLLFLACPISQAQQSRDISLVYMEGHLRTTKAYRGKQLQLKCQSIKCICICNWRRWEDSSAQMRPGFSGIWWRMTGVNGLFFWDRDIVGKSLYRTGQKE